MNLNRRDFIKLSLATGAAATIGVSTCNRCSCDYRRIYIKTP